MSKLLKMIRSGLVVTTIFDNWYELNDKIFFIPLGFQYKTYS